MNPEPYVIVGAGQAGVQLAEALRSADAQTPIILLGDEPHAPYHRPPLSKQWLAGEFTEAQLTIRGAEALAGKGIELRTGVSVETIDRAARSLRLRDGSTLHYRGLALALGASARRLPLPGFDAEGVLTLRSRADAERLASALARLAAASAPLVVVGGGFIGLEIAASARKMGIEVTVLEAQSRLLARAVAPPVSERLATLHREHGVRLLLDCGVSAVETQAGAACAVACADGTRYPAGLVVVGVGAAPNDALARAAGLDCERGVVVDPMARTADPAIVAAGDCTVRREADGRMVRLESVHNAVEQARQAAAALLGQPRASAVAPWFWSEQYGVRLQIAGLARDDDATEVRGDLAAARATVFRFAGGRLQAADSLDDAKTHLLVRRLLDKQVTVSREQVRDATFDLSTLLS